MNFSGDIPRIEDLPYYYSPPLQFTFTQQATLTLGQYPFTAGRAAVGNNKNITDNTLLYFREMTFSADISLANYQIALQLAGGTVDIPRFSLFLTSEANAPVLVDPIQLDNYFNGQTFRRIVLPKQLPNTLSGFFRGTLQQHGGLAGVTEINLTMNMWVQAISDDNFVEAMKQKYPDLRENC